MKKRMGISENIELLSNLHGASGDEYPASVEVKKLFEPLCDECMIDKMYNVIGIKRSKNPQGKLMIDAHIDELGLMVSDIDERGFIFFETLGGFDARTLLAQEVVIHGRRDIPGIIGIMPVHIISEEEKGKTIPRDKMYIDTGYSAEEVKKIVRLSDTITMKGKTLRLLNGRISTKAQDDRTSVAVIISVLEQLQGVELPFDLYVVASTQEEEGHGGAIVATYDIDPDLAIAIDVCHGKSPDASDGVFPMGSGTVIAKGPNIHPGMLKAVTDALDKAEIGYSLNIHNIRTGTNAAITQISRCGIPSVLFALPLRYMHTCIETVDVADAQATADGITAFLKSIDKVGDILCY